MECWGDNDGLAEAARGLRTSVFFGCPEGRGKTLLVTSPEAGDGKSLTAAMLGIAMAQSHQRTLLMKLNMSNSIMKKEIVSR